MNTNISDVIEREPLGNLQRITLLLACLAVVIDGFDLQVIAFVGPKLMQEWGLSKAELGQAISAALIGMGFGAPIGGWLGDKFGRKKAMIFSVMFFGVTTLPVAYVTEVWQLIALRFITGLGFGAVFPNTTAILAEWLPTRWRGYGISLMIIGVPLGGALGAAISSYLIPNYGWQSCFLAAGGMGVFFGLLLIFLLPESPKFLIKNTSGEEVPALLNKAFGEGKFAETETFFVDEPPASSWSDIFAPQHRRVTIGIVIGFFANLLAYYGMANWIPTIVTSLGFSLELGTKSALYMNLFSLIGALVVPYLLIKLGSKTTLLSVLLIAILGVGATALTTTAEQVNFNHFLYALSFSGIFLGGLQVGLYTLASAAYPTNCRSTGIGFAAGAGRIGPILSGFGGAFILSAQGGNTLFFSVIVLILILAIVGILLVNRHMPPAKSA